MSEISVQFKNQLNGYNKNEVDLLLKKIEEELQQRAATIDAMQQQIAGLEAKLEEALTPQSVEAAEKVELYDKLIKKMDGDFRNLLAPAQAKAKAIEEKALADYELRMSEAKAAADSIYAEAVDRIADAVNANMDRMYDLLDSYMEEYVYSKSFPGRVEAFRQSCNDASMKVASGIVAAARIPGRAARAVGKKVQNAIEALEAEDTSDCNEEYEL